MTKEHILVVDDEEDILELIRFHLEREGFRVSCAETGEKASTRITVILPSGRVVGDTHENPLNMDSHLDRFSRGSIGWTNPAAVNWAAPDSAWPSSNT